MPNGGSSSGRRASRWNEVRCARLRSGIELHYVERGAGAPLILVHGGSGDLESWSAQIDEFARRYRVIAYSRRYNYPNSNSAIVPDYSVRHDAKDLAGLLCHLELREVRLIGSSYGAFSALAFALEHSRAVAGLVLAEPPVHRLVPSATYRRFLREVWKPAKAAFESGKTRRAMQTLADGMWGRPVFARLPHAVKAAMMRNAPAMQALVLSRNAFPSLASDKLRRLRVPALLVAGQRAALIHRLGIRALAQLLPRATERTIPRAAHGSPRENPAAFNRLVLDFLAQH